jgi:hypothetical protein
LKAGAITDAQARTEADKIIDDLHKPQEAIALKKYERDFKLWEHNRNRKDALSDRERSEQVEGEWVRGADGQERFVPKAERKPGMVRHDKPKDAPEPGTEPGDYRVLQDGANSGKTDTREYYAAWNRVKNKFIDIGNGQKLPPDMRAFPEPTFKEAQDRPAPTPIHREREQEPRLCDAVEQRHPPPRSPGEGQGRQVFDQEPAGQSRAGGGSSGLVSGIDGWREGQAVPRT